MSRRSPFCKHEVLVCVSDGLEPLCLGPAGLPHIPVFSSNVGGPWPFLLSDHCMAHTGMMLARDLRDAGLGGIKCYLEGSVVEMNGAAKRSGLQENFARHVVSEFYCSNNKEHRPSLGIVLKGQIHTHEKADSAIISTATAGMPYNASEWYLNQRLCTVHTVGAIHADPLTPSQIPKLCRRSPHRGVRLMELSETLGYGQRGDISFADPAGGRIGALHPAEGLCVPLPGTPGQLQKPQLFRECTQHPVLILSPQREFPCLQHAPTYPKSLLIERRDQ